MDLTLLTSVVIALVLTLVDARRGHALDSVAPPLFVFGSSYADTGNLSPTDKTQPYPWAKPYGETWPGAPAGRYSDGHVLTDIVVDILNMSLPTPFRSVKRNGSSKEPHGVNFATSGSTILTSSSMPSVSSQIDAFQSNIMSKYTPQQLASAIVLYCTSGDDYFFYLATSSSSLSSIYPLTVNVGKQISMDLVKLYGLGLRKFFVAYLPPSGCLPVASSANRYKGCNDTWTRSIAVPHNERIFKNVLGLRHYFKNGTILLIDLFSAFSAAQSEIGKPPNFEPNEFCELVE